MLIIEQQANGKNIVKLKKEWHPNRIGKAHNPNKNYVDSRDMEQLQSALLRKVIVNLKGNQS
jgi:hypothetical protein